MSHKVAITGASGFIGSHLTAVMGEAGWEVLKLGRDSSSDIQFNLGQTVSGEVFRARGVEALIHCAYDFSARSWSDIRARNVEGTKHLLSAAKLGGVEKVIVLSSISAFTGARSLYGRAKLEIEQAGLSVGALVVRPGLVYADEPPNSGMFASLSQSAQAKFVPLIDGGRYPQYLVHVADLALLLRQFLEGEIDAPNRPVTVASSKAWPIRALLKVMARERGNKPRFVSVPWQVVWVALSAAEKAGLKLNYRSDSVLSLVYQNPHPDFESLAQLGIRVRDFRG